MPGKLNLSVSELMQMRQEGMTNRDIAKVLDVSYATIVRRIGPAPGRQGRQTTPRFDRADTPAINEKKEFMPVMENFGDMQRMQDIAILDGYMARYAVDRIAKSVRCTIKNVADVVCYDIHTLRGYINELRCVLHMLGKTEDEETELASSEKSHDELQSAGR